MEYQDLNFSGHESRGATPLDQSLARTNRETELITSLSGISQNSHGCVFERKQKKTPQGIIYYTVLRAAPDAEFKLSYDLKFTNSSFRMYESFCDFGSIPYKNHAESSRKMGFTLSEYLQSPGRARNAIALTPNTIGMHLGEVLISNGTLFTLPIDTMHPRDAVILYKNKQVWTFGCFTTSADSRRITSEIALGFSVPLFIKAGRALNLELLIGKLGYNNDPTLGLNFAVGGESDEFITALKKGPLNIVNSGVYSQLYHGSCRCCFENYTSLNSEELKLINLAMTDKTREYYEINTSQSGRTQIYIKKPLPKQRIPAVMLGHNVDGEFLSITFDGPKDSDSIGATFEEMQQISLAEEMWSGGLGAVGSLASCSVKTGDTVIPASFNGTAETVRCPAALIISAQNQ